jgi:cystathionine beta-lyase family protein involved in aluminum resistance
MLVLRVSGPWGHGRHALLRLRRSPRPYDTMEEVIGLRGTPGHGSLREWGVAYREVPLAASGSIDWQALATSVTPRE